MSREPRPPSISEATASDAASIGFIQVSSSASCRGSQVPVTGTTYASDTACWRSSVNCAPGNGKYSATENGTGLVFYGTELQDAFTEVEGKLAYSLTRDGGTTREVALETRLL